MQQEILENHCHELVRASSLVVCSLYHGTVEFLQPGLGLTKKPGQRYFRTKHLLVRNLELKGRNFYVTHEMWIKSLEELEKFLAINDIVIMKNFIKQNGMEVSFAYESMLHLKYEDAKIDFFQDMS